MRIRNTCIDRVVPDLVTAFVVIFNKSELNKFNFCAKPSYRRCETVEGLYCKRPTQKKMSGVFQKYWPPPPPSPLGVCVPPAFGAGGGHTRWVEKGWGVSILEDARHCSVLYICKHFVCDTNKVN
jgi:hypothetical protein